MLRSGRKKEQKKERTAKLLTWNMVQQEEETTAVKKKDNKDIKILETLEMQVHRSMKNQLEKRFTNEKVL